MISQELYRQVIMDHYKNPYNKVEDEVEGYARREALNPSCGDEIVVFLKYDGDQVVDIKFKGTGCSICCASASVMTNELTGLTKTEIINKVNKFNQIIKDADESVLDEFEDAQAFIGIKAFPARFKCAYLSWDTVRKLVEEV